MVVQQVPMLTEEDMDTIVLMVASGEDIPMVEVAVGAMVVVVGVTDTVKKFCILIQNFHDSSIQTSF